MSTSVKLNIDLSPDLVSITSPIVESTLKSAFDINILCNSDIASSALGFEKLSTVLLPIIKAGLNSATASFTGKLSYIPPSKSKTLFISTGRINNGNVIDALIDLARSPSLSITNFVESISAATHRKGIIRLSKLFFASTEGCEKYSINA